MHEIDEDSSLVVIWFDTRSDASEADFLLVYQYVNCEISCFIGMISRFREGVFWCVLNGPYFVFCGFPFPEVCYKGYMQMVHTGYKFPPVGFHLTELTALLDVIRSTLALQYFTVQENISFCVGFIVFFLYFSFFYL